MSLSPARRAFWLLTLALPPALSACGGGDSKDTGAAAELLGPNLEHTLGEGQLTAGDPLEIEVTARDPGGRYLKWFCPWVQCEAHGFRLLGPARENPHITRRIDGWKGEGDPGRRGLRRTVHGGG